ncbi:MAG: hypothetical protein ACFCGT_22405 [Sandaracinaceae bacterium]
MRIFSESRISHPQEAVYAAYRDRLPEIAAYIPDVKAIVQKTREDVAPGEIKIHNEWIADRDVPFFARGFLKPEMLRWDDFAHWKDAEGAVHWRLKLRIFTDSVTCGGVNRFVADGVEHTRVVLDGDLAIDLATVPGVPSFLAGGLRPKLEQFIVGLITPNLERVNQSLQQFLDDHGG